MELAIDKVVWKVHHNKYDVNIFTKEEAYREIKEAHKLSPNLCFKIRYNGDTCIILYREIPKELMEDEEVCYE